MNYVCKPYLLFEENALNGRVFENITQNKLLNLIILSTLANQDCQKGIDANNIIESISNYLL